MPSGQQPKGKIAAKAGLTLSMGRVWTTGPITLRTHTTDSGILRFWLPGKMSHPLYLDTMIYPLWQPSHSIQVRRVVKGALRRHGNISQPSDMSTSALGKELYTIPQITCLWLGNIPRSLFKERLSAESVLVARLGGMRETATLSLQGLPFHSPHPTVDVWVTYRSWMGLRRVEITLQSRNRDLTK